MIDAVADAPEHQPEVRSAQEAIDFSRLAIEAGVDIVNLYAPASLHGDRPTDGELTAYFDEVLTASSTR